MESETIKNKQQEQRPDVVNHPRHYTWLKDFCGIEPIEICRHLNFNRGNALKYILRAGHKQEQGITAPQKEIQDLEKAIFCLTDEIKLIKQRYFLD